MLEGEGGLKKTQPVDQLLYRQAVVLSVITMISYLLLGIDSIIVVLFGGMIAIINTCIQKWHIMMAAKYAKADPEKNLARIYRCIAERWVMTLLLFAIGFSLLSDAMLLLITFTAMQFVVLFGNLNRA